MTTVYSGWTESEERILERMKRMLADWTPPAKPAAAESVAADEPERAEGVKS
jgi:hypothetical protein